ncbi:unnamed protein product [Camellia sinensis]
MDDCFPKGMVSVWMLMVGNKTDLVICSYDDHFLVIATQIGSMGTILHARKEEGMLIQPTFNVSVICGKRDEPMLVACARQLIENIRIETLKGIVHAVVENRLCKKKLSFAELSLSLSKWRLMTQLGIKLLNSIVW